jgi:hypothetical protein
VELVLLALQGSLVELVLLALQGSLVELVLLALQGLLVELVLLVPELSYPVQEITSQSIVVIQQL